MSNTQLATQVSRPSALRLMADRCNVDSDKLHQTLKNTVFKGATDDEMLALVVTCNVYELNPLLKEIYAFPKKGGGITPMVGVDGWLKIANRQSNYDGLAVEVFGDGKTPTHAVCEIFLKDRTHPVKITEYFDECKRGTDPWNQMPRRMLRNKVMIQAIRVAFGIGGIQDEDEAADIANGMRTTTGHVIPDHNPYSDAAPVALPEPTAPAAAAKKAPAKAKADKPAAAAPPPVKMPPRTEMTPAIRQAYRDAGITVLADAEAKIRAAGLMPEGKNLNPQDMAQKLTDAEMHRIYLVKDTLFVATAPPADESDPGADYPMDDEPQPEGDQGE